MQSQEKIEILSNWKYWCLDRFIQLFYATLLVLHLYYITSAPRLFFEEMAFLWGWTLQLSTQEYLGIGLQRSWNWITPSSVYVLMLYAEEILYITQVWIEFLLLSLSWLLQLFFSRNVSWKRIFGPTNLVQHTFYWKLLKKYAKYRSGFFEIFFINMKSDNIHQDPKHLQLCKNITFQQLYYHYISVKWGIYSKFHY